jgi:diketogulonate reductase-like aldo/keto reductase
MADVGNLTLESKVQLISGYSLPRLGFGVYKAEDAVADVTNALKAGYRHIDSAQWYENEEEVGRAVRASDIPRDEIFITTKIDIKMKDPKEAASSIDASLKKAGLDYFDLFLVHDPNGGKHVRLGKYQALLDAQKEGKIRTVGVSNYGPKHIEEIVEAGLPLPAVNQVELHPFNQQKAIVSYCQSKNIIVQAYCPLIRGAMSDQTLISIAQKHGRDPAQILLRWSLQHGFVPLPKSSTPSRIVSNANLYDFELDEEDMRKLDGLDKGKAGSIAWDPVDVD